MSYIQTKRKVLFIESASSGSVFEVPCSFITAEKFNNDSRLLNELVLAEGKINILERTILEVNPSSVANVAMLTKQATEVMK